MELFEAIKERRSVRRYKPVPVIPDALTKIIEAARWAPSWANTQCWKLIVVDDRALKDRLVATMPTGNPAAAVKDAPITIVVCAELGKAGFYKGQAGTDKGDWFMFDTGLISENICLAATALGLGTVIIGLADSARIGEIIGLPSGVVAVCLIPVGYPDDLESVRRTKRKESTEFVFHNRYGVQ